ncbi:hypothetical protein [Micromonospora purpureochromogenes]|uniref:Uncharacterized protein n=1 Tax=Micromonospora purpureochromogenes TaxID=47872 RepID=A0ABX2RK17_9ACTN|nr:hypothetical protein [Micromonospora purpureochromogenes]NYF56676.1 hypothetical protein [Micromonospora purpureochromogenes]
MIASDANREGVIATFTFTEQPNHRWKVTRAQATPIWLSLKPTLRVVNLPAIVEHMPSVDRRRALYIAAMDRITGYLDARGAEAAGLHIVR